MPCRLFRRSVFPILVLVLTTGLAPEAVFAQQARLTGRVTDPDGGAVPRAQILIRRSGALVLTASTSNDGRFIVDALSPGRYALDVAIDGFLADTVTLDVAAGETRTIDIGLRVSAFSESVVVSSSQVDQLRSNVPDSLTVVTAQDLAALQIETVADALRLVPGLTVTASGGRGGLTALFPRGGESDFTLVLLDGVRVNDFGGGYDFAHLPVGDIERIEIVRGPQSAVYGSDAIGGVVHIITRHGGPPRVASVIETGSLGTTRLSVDSSGERGAWTWGTGIEQLDSDGFTGTSATGERVTNDDYRRRDLSASAAWEPNADTRLRTDYRIGSNERGVPGPFGLDPGGTFSGVDTVSRGANEMQRIGASLTRRWSSRLRQQIDITHARLDGDFVSPFGESFSQTRRWALHAQTDAMLGPRVDLSAGVDLQRERAGSTFITGADFLPVPVRRWTTGYYGEARVRPHPRLSLVAGLRIEQVRHDAIEGDPLSFFPRPAFAARSEARVNPKVAVGWTMRQSASSTGHWTRLRFSAGTGFRPPAVFELAFTNNPDLRSERSRSIDVGVEQGLAGGAVVLDATAFFNRYDDLIVAVAPSLRDASQFVTDNIANSRAHGVELSAAARLPHGVSVHASYTGMATEVLAVDGLPDRAPAPFSVGDRLLRRPRHQGVVDVTLARRRGSGFVRMTTRGNVLDVDPSFGAFGGLFTAEGYTAIDLGASLRLWRGIELLGRVENVSGRTYEEALGFPAPGRRGTIGVRIASR